MQPMTGVDRRCAVDGPWTSLDAQAVDQSRRDDLGVSDAPGGSVIFAEGRFYCLTALGTMLLQACVVGSGGQRICDLPVKFGLPIPNVLWGFAALLTVRM